MIVTQIIVGMIICCDLSLLKEVLLCYRFSGAVADVSSSNIGAVGGMQINEGEHDIRNDYGDALKQEVRYSRVHIVSDYGRLSDYSLLIVSVPDVFL